MAMQIGDVIARLEDETVAEEALIALGDLALAARVANAAACEAMTRGEFVAACVGRFVARASDDEWVSLLGQMGRVADPGHVLLRRAIETAMSAAAAPKALPPG